MRYRLTAKIDGDLRDTGVRTTLYRILSDAAQHAASEWLPPSYVIPDDRGRNIVTVVAENDRKKLVTK